MANTRPLRVLQISQDGHFLFNTDAFVSVLEKVGSRPFVLYSINGRSRDGKSYVLNHFLRFFKRTDENWFSSQLPQEFIWRGGRERVTSGINLWSEPFFETRNGREIGILLMDCQGLFDDQTTPQQNAIIYSLSNLLSSVMIYNLKERIDEPTLQTLHFYSDYTNAIASADDIDGKVDPFPKMIILIRDFPYFHDYEFGYHDDHQCPL